VVTVAVVVLLTAVVVSVAAGVDALLALSSQAANRVERANNAASAGNFTNRVILSMRFPRESGRIK
jgi:FlaG/FlaF family flagellin (archaellin)